MSEVKYRRVGLYCNLQKPDAPGLAKRAWQRLKELGAEPIISRDLAEAIGKDSRVATRSEVCSRSEALVVLGGDGTLLGAARESYSCNVPILGINLGYLGFLSETPVELMDEQIQLMVEGRFNSSKRMVLWVKVEKPKGCEASFQSPVINEIHVFRRSTGRIVHLPTYVNDDYLTSYRADGLLVSTPTGSTGHSMSAGGPILRPELRAITITPVCAHTLAIRAIVIDDSDMVSIQVHPGDEDISLTVDGQVDAEVPGGATITVHAANHPVTLVTTGRMGFFEVLREKLYLGEVSAARAAEKAPKGENNG